MNYFQTVCASLHPIAMAITMTKSKLGRKRLISSYNLLSIMKTNQQAMFLYGLSIPYPSFIDMVLVKYMLRKDGRIRTSYFSVS